MSDHPFATQPPRVSRALVAFPTSHILLVTLDRPSDLNCIDITGSHELDALWKWYDSEPTLRCAVITGSGRAFCTGGDLKGILLPTPLRFRINESPFLRPHVSSLARLTQPVPSSTQNSTASATLLRLFLIPPKPASAACQ